MQQIKGIKVNGVRFATNISAIESHMTSPNGTDFLVKITDDGTIYGYAEGVDIDNPSSDSQIENLTDKLLVLKDANMDRGERTYYAEIVDGELLLTEKKGQLHMPAASALPNATSTATLALCINEVYANADAECIRNAEHNTSVPVSHNFVEIANLNPYNTYDLSNVTLQYYNPAEKNDANKGWHVLHLKGHINPGSTFLIRGAKVANSEAPSTIINVDTFDMEWYENGELMAFNNTNGTLYLSHDQVAYPETPWVTSKAEGKVSELPNMNPALLLNYEVSGGKKLNVAPSTYLDLIGWGDSFYEGGSGERPTGSPNYIFVRRNMLDRSQQALATKLDARTNKVGKFWEVVDLKRNDMGNEASFKPCSVREKKNIYTTRSDMRLNKPYCVTVTFGIDPTTTRCFNWVSPGIKDEFIFYRKKGETEWQIKESYKAGDGRDSDIRTKEMPFENVVEGAVNTYKMDLPFYDRIYWETSGGRFVTTHKVILRDLENDLKYYTSNTLTEPSATPTEFTKGQVYEYCVGQAIYDRYKAPIAPDMEHCSGVYEFQVRKATTGTWRFIQHSDEQGFNDCEYQVWRRSANIIRAQFNPHFTIDTGDMTQNGNRLSEWLDYNSGVESLSQGLPLSFKLTDPTTNTVKTYANESAGVEQMNVVGNNDLAPLVDYIVGNGNDAKALTDTEGKVSTRQFKYFYCYELDVDNLPVNLRTKDEKSKVAGHENEYESEVETWIPSCYSFNYNNCHFTAICSEITPSSAVNEFGERYTGSQSDAKLASYSKTYDLIENWVQKDLNKWYALSLSPETTATYPWAICYMHEMPWTILTSDFAGADNTEKRLDGCKLNDYGSMQFHMSEIFQNNRVRLVIGGHKHTHSHSWPTAENVTYLVDGVSKYSWELTAEQLADANIQRTREVDSKHTVVCLPYATDNDTVDNYTKFYTGAVNAKTGNVHSPARFHYNAQMYKTTEDKETWLPIYIMSQASANKVVSNKEKPANSIPFLHYYYPQDEATGSVLSDQLFPHFVEYEFVQDNEGNPKNVNIRHYRINENNFCNGKPYKTVYQANESLDKLATGAPLRANIHQSVKMAEDNIVADIATTLNWISRENSRTLAIAELGA